MLVMGRRMLVQLALAVNLHPTMDGPRLGDRLELSRQALKGRDRASINVRVSPFRYIGQLLGK
jgi:hypothetical protein